MLPGIAHVIGIEKGHAHINVLGRYQFSLSEAIQQGGSRPLRNPSDPEEHDY